MKKILTIAIVTAILFYTFSMFLGMAIDMNEKFKNYFIALVLTVSLINAYGRFRKSMDNETKEAHTGSDSKSAVKALKQILNRK